MSCFVKNCKNIRRLMPPDSTIGFFSFPKEERRFREWLNAIDRGTENIVWSKGIFICSAHFRAEDLCFRGVRTRVSEFAVPFVATSSVDDNETSLKRSAVKLSLSPTPEAPPSKLPKEEPLSSDANSDNELENQNHKNLTSKPGTPSGSDSSLTRRLNVKLDHPYGVCPETAKVKYAEMEKKLHTKSKELYRAREKIKSLKKRINYLKVLLKNKNNLH